MIARRLSYKPNILIILIVVASAYSTNPFFDFFLIAVLFIYARKNLGFFLGVLITTPTLDIEVYGNTYRAVVLLVIFFLVYRPFGLKKPGNTYIARGIIAFFPLYVTSLLGKFTNSNLVALQFFLLGLGAFWLVGFLLQNETREVFQRGFLYGISNVGLINSVIVLIQISRISDDPVFGHLYENRPTGLYLEPDFLGYFALISLIAVYYLKPKWTSILVVIPLITSLIMSLARASWLSSFIFLLFFVIFAGGTSRFFVKILQSIFALSCCFIFLVDLVPQSQFNLVQDRIASITQQNPTDTARLARIRQWDGLGELARRSPWYGAGLTSSGRIQMQGSISNEKTENNVGSNWILSFWAEAKLLSLSYFAIAILAVFRARKTVFQPMLIITFVNSLFTNMVWYTITPVLLGLAIHFSRDRLKTHDTTQYL